MKKIAAVAVGFLFLLIIPGFAQDRSAAELDQMGWADCPLSRPFNCRNSYRINFPKPNC